MAGPKLSDAQADLVYVLRTQRVALINLVRAIVRDHDIANKHVADGRFCGCSDLMRDARIMSAWQIEIKAALVEA